MKKQISMALKWCLWFAAFPCLLMIVMVPEQPIYLIPVIFALIWMAGSTIATWIDESKKERNNR